jgi:hypothetical protein
MSYSPIEDRYLSTLTQQQFPDMPPEQLAAGPSDTMTDGGPARIELRGMATPDKTPRVGRAGVPYQPPSIRDITEPAGAMLDMGAATAKGAVQGFAGLPGDLEKIGRLVFGAMGVDVSQDTALPTTDEVKAWLDKNVGQVGNGQNPYESIGEVTAPGGQIKAVKAAGRGAKALAPKAGEMIVDSMEKLGTPVKMDLMAYHGSPHKVDKFDSSKIGTGEGNQSYGYGLYFAESKDVAGSYASALSEPKLFVRGKEVKVEPGSPTDVASAWLADVYDRGFFNSKTSDPFSQAIADIEKAPVPNKEAVITAVNDLKKRGATMKQGGNLYTVDIPDEMVGRMLDFEKRIGEQSAEVQALAKEFGLSPDDLGGDLLAAARGKTAGGAKMMREAGIPGVRYLDQGSRSVGTGTKNIVVFPGGEDQVQVLKHEGKK